MTDIPVAADTPPGEHAAVHDPELNVFGMWVFLAGEVIFFGSVFAAYLVYRMLYPQAFAEASSHLSVVIGGVNTAILLTSSFTMALAVYAAQTGRRRTLVTFLLATLVLGAVFLGLKGVEYALEFRENLFPGRNFVFPGPGAQQAELFFSLYFTLTGLHAVHMLIGMSLIAVLAFLAWRGRFSRDHYDPVELVGLFWHFVDVVWIFIFPLLYLIQRS